MRIQLYNFAVKTPQDTAGQIDNYLTKQSYYNMPDIINQTVNLTSVLFGDGRDIELASDIVFRELGWFLL